MHVGMTGTDKLVWQLLSLALTGSSCGLLSVREEEVVVVPPAGDKPVDGVSRLCGVVYFRLQTGGDVWE